MVLWAMQAEAYCDLYDAPVFVVTTYEVSTRQYLRYEAGRCGWGDANHVIMAPGTW
jgi:hypothetical protein